MVSPPLTVKFCILTTGLKPWIQIQDEDFQIQVTNTELTNKELYTLPFQNQNLKNASNSGIISTELEDIAVKHDKFVGFLQEWSTECKNILKDSFDSVPYHKKEISTKDDDSDNNIIIIRRTLLHVHEKTKLMFYIIYYNKDEVKFNFKDDYTRWKSEWMFLKLLLESSTSLRSTQQYITLTECIKQISKTPEFISNLIEKENMKDMIDNLKTESKTTTENRLKAEADYNDFRKQSAFNESGLDLFGGAKKRLHTRRRPRSNRTIHNKRTIRSRPHLSDVNSPQSSSADMLHLNKMS